jgi:hypothetical protein
MTIVDGRPQFAARREMVDMERVVVVKLGPDVLERLDHIIAVLNSSSICRLEAFDHEWAARTRAYFASLVAGQPVNETEQRSALDWVYSHGQSLDWIFDGDATTLIVRAAIHAPTERGPTVHQRRRHESECRRCTL